LETQEIQSRNLAATQQLSRYAMTLTNGQINTTRENANTNLNSGFNSAQSMQMQNSSQGFIGMH
jgi:hypothetical protein